MSSDEMNQTTDTNSMPDSPSNKRHCPVCGDKTTGKHYGVYSCESCKLFFKRSAKNGHKYTCSKNKKCVIDKEQRNDCKYCRYQKCLSVAMKYEEKPERFSNHEKAKIPEVNHGYRMRRRNRVKSYSEIEEDDEKDPAYRGDLGKEWERIRRRKSHRPRESVKSYFSGSGSESGSDQEKKETEEESEQEEEVELQKAKAKSSKKSMVTKQTKKFQLDGKTEFSATYQPKLKIGRVQDKDDSEIDETDDSARAKKPATANKSRVKRRRKR